MLQNPTLDLDTTNTSTTTPTTTAPMHLSTIGMQQMMANNGYSSSASPASSTTTSAPFYNMTFNPQMQHQHQHQPITPLPNNSRSSPLSDNSSMLTMKRPSNASSVTSASGRRKGYGNTPEETYTGVKRPFNYAEGFHYLIQHVRDK